MEFRILGPLQVFDAQGQPLALSPRQARLLATLLLSAGRVVSLDELIDAVWDDDPPATARRQVHNAVWMLRRNVSIVAERPGYRIVLRPGQLDAQQFEAALAKARELAEGGMLSQAADELESALRLWRGVTLPGCQSIRLRAAADRLDELRLAATEQWAEWGLMLGRHARLASELTGLVAAHPLRETLAGLFMRTLHGCGRQADALALYQRLRTMLAAEFGIDPSAAVQQVYERILRDTGAGFTAGSTPQAAIMTHTWALPPRLAYFTGRRTELETLASAHSQGRSPDVVTLWGLAGIGKTCVALEYAHRAASVYRLVAWIPGVRRDSAFAALSALGQHLGVTAAGPEELVHRTLSELDRWAPWLLVYDDADPDEIKPLLPAHGNGDVLITSRSPEWADVGDDFELGLLTHEEAVTLLLRQSADNSPEAHGQASLLIRRLGHLPAAIGSAAEYCRGTCSIAEYRQLLGQSGLDLMRPKHSLANGSENALTVRFSHRRITDSTGAARQLLTLLAWFAPGYLPQSVIRHHAHLLPRPLHDIASDARSWHRCVAELRAAGLVRAEPGWLWSHELVQEIQRQRYSDHQRTPRAWRSLVLSLIAADFPVSWNDTDSWDHCTALLPHARAVVDDESLSGARLGALSDKVVSFYLARGHYNHALDLSQRTYELRRQKLGVQDPLTLRAMNYLAMSSHRLGHYADATEIHRQELELSRTLLGRDHPGTLASMNNLARALDSLGDHAAAYELHQQTLDARSRILGAAHPATLSSLNNLGNVLLRMREYQRALDTHQQALQQRRRVLGPHHAGTLQSMNNLANVLYRLCDVAAAERHQEVAEIREQILGPNHPDTLISLNNLANALHAQGDHYRSSALHRRVLTARFSMHGPDNPQVLRSMGNLAAVLRSIGDDDRATQLQQRCIDGRRRVLGPQHPDTIAAAHETTEPPDPTPNNSEDIK